MKSFPAKTKKCPFCAETIQAEALKCRFCGEFLSADQQQAAIDPAQAGNDQTTNENQDNSESTLFKGRPSLLGITSMLLRAIPLIALAGLLVFYPLEELPQLNLNGSQITTFAHYRKLAGLALMVLIILIVLAKATKLKCIYYEVTANRIEWRRGILSRKIDNLDMFRVIDMKLHRSLLDCMLGIGTITLITTDKTDPEFDFEKIKKPRTLYDIIKKASLDADRYRRVVHLE